MAFAPLILQGNKQIGPNNAGALVNVDIQVIDFRVYGERDMIEIPATYGKKMSFGAGNDKYKLEIRYLMDNDVTALSEIFWTALGDAVGTINFKASMRSGAISATNQAWIGIGVISNVDVGGTVNSVGISTVTIPLLDRPTKVSV